MIEIKNQDCIIGMKELKENSVDLILTDPPFRIAMDKEADEKVKRWRGGDIITSEWDKFESKEEFDNFNKAWLSEAYRVLRPKGWCCVFNHWRNIPDFVKLAESLGFRYANLFTWFKPNAALSFPIGLVQSCEYVIVLYKESKEQGFTKFINNHCIMRDCLVHNAITPKEKEEASGHPTVKPKDILMKFITQFTKEGDMVLDCFSGSGSTAVACQLLNRNFIGFELDENYVSESLKRLERYQSQMGLKQWMN